jgi:hypothetical protein
VLVVGAARETIGDDVGGTLHVLDIEVEVSDHILPARLPSGEHRLCLEMLEGFVIRANQELAPGEVVPPRVQGVDDSE